MRNPAELTGAALKHRLGLGELSTVMLGKEIHAEIALVDDLRARRLAKESGLQVQGSVGTLELLHRRGHLADLRKAFQGLLASGVYIDRALLEERLRDLKLPPL